MAIGAAARELVRDLRTQKLRTFLTTFGIVWGTVAVSLLLAFGKGFHKQIAKAQNGLGEGIFIAWPSMTSMPFEGLGKGRRIRLEVADMAGVRAESVELAGISGEWQQTLNLDYGTKTLPVDSSGVEPIFGAMRNIIPAAGGRWLNDIDEARQRRVLFIGDKLATDLLGNDPPVGRTVMVQGSPFLIVGVLKKKQQDSSYSNRDEEKVFLPASTFRALTGQRFVDNFVAQPKSALRAEQAKNETIRILARRHRFDPKDKEALGIWDTTEGAKFLETFMLAFRGFLGVVGSLTLIVGGIGVMNIMNVVVEERTREIGIKMALGAKPRAVLSQLLLETVLLTGIGGAIGMLMAWGICLLVPDNEYVGKPEFSATLGMMTAAMLGVDRPPRRLVPGARRGASGPRRGHEALEEGTMRLGLIAQLFLRSSRVQRKRAVLTISAIAWGSVSLLLLLSFGEGLRRQLSVGTVGMGKDIAVIWPGATGKAYKGLPPGREIKVVIDDIELLRARMPEAQVSGEIQTGRASIVWGKKTVNGRLRGVWADYEDIRHNFPREGGRFLDPLDVSSSVG
jgi:putative ABC transport system permease protein